jgi:hypothetical protein
VKIAIEVAPVTPEAAQAIEDLWVAVLRAALEARAQEQRANQADERGTTSSPERG